MKLTKSLFVFYFSVVIILLTSTSALAVDPVPPDLSFYTYKWFLVHVQQKGFCATDETLTTILDKNNDIENIYIQFGPQDGPYFQARYYFEDDGNWYWVLFQLKYKFGTAEDAVLETDPPFSYNSDYPYPGACELTTIYFGIRLVTKFENGIQTGKISHVAGVGKDRECIVQNTILSSKMIDVSLVPDEVRDAPMIPPCSSDI